MDTVIYSGGTLPVTIGGLALTLPILMAVLALVLWALISGTKFLISFAPREVQGTVLISATLAITSLLLFGFALFSTFGWMTVPMVILLVGGQALCKWRVTTKMIQLEDEARHNLVIRN